MGQVITIGDVQDPITKAFQAELQAYIDEIQHTGVNEAWFQVALKWWPKGVIREGVVIPMKTLVIKIGVFDFQPPKLLATACYHVNYRKGKLTRLWMLPPEDPGKMELAGRMGWLGDSHIKKNEGPMRETETIEDAQSIKPALIHRPH